MEFGLNQAVGSVKGYLDYQDSGCEYVKSCLECPCTECLEVERGGQVHWLKRMRNDEIKRYHGEGYTVKGLMVIFGYGERTIRRVLEGFVE